MDDVKNEITDAYTKGKISDLHYNLLNEKRQRQSMIILLREIEVQDCDNLPISYKNPQPSNIQSTQEYERYKQIQKELQDTKKELEDLKQQQQKTEGIGGNGKNVASSTIEVKDEYFRLDLNRFMTVITLIARNPRNQPHAYAYLEPDKNKDIVQIIAPYNFEEYKNEKAAKKIEAESTSNNWS